MVGEFVGGEAEDDEVFVFVGLVDFFEGFVLRGEAAFAGGVDDEDNFAFVFFERLFFAIEAVYFEGVEIFGFGIEGGGLFGHEEVGDGGYAKEEDSADNQKGLHTCYITVFRTFESQRAVQ